MLIVTPSGLTVPLHHDSHIYCFEHVNVKWNEMLRKLFILIYNVSHRTWAGHMLSPILYFAVNNLDILCGTPAASSLLQAKHCKQMTFLKTYKNLNCSNPNTHMRAPSVEQRLSSIRWGCAQHLKLLDQVFTIHSSSLAKPSDHEAVLKLR